MPLTPSNLSQQLDELSLLKHSLLPGEQLIHASPPSHQDSWQALLESWQESGDTDLRLERAVHALPPAHFRIQAEGIHMWFELWLGGEYGGPQRGVSGYTVAVKGATLGRKDQEAWQAFVQEKMEEVHSQDKSRTPETDTLECYHALFTSHHLVSPTKRRSLQQWSASLSLTGFAKVGHPGVIYCEGARAQVEEFVANVKAMQWLALRLRFIEPLSDELLSVQGSDEQRGRWVEFEKVGEVVDEMRRLGRGEYVVEMGIGSARTNTGPLR
ncbi:hypothetical protein C8Q72DRAFT_779852 [Fomitopsis betulina]|nr:hypothetical protein C8Q72DRAFT_779852 [Fomitopsis betulina]